MDKFEEKNALNKKKIRQSSKSNGQMEVMNGTDVKAMEKIQEFLKTEHLVKKASTTALDYAIIQGVLMRTKEKPDSSEVVHQVPFTLFPSPVPRKSFHQAVAVQRDFNLLMHVISQDFEFMKSAYQSVLQSDHFTRNLFHIYETVHKENPKKYELSIIRPDYMLHTMKDGGRSLKQIEINMIAASCNAIGAGAMTNVHRHTLMCNGFENLIGSLPENKALYNTANCLVAAWSVYGNEVAIIVFIVTEEERNIFDQRRMEFQINEINPRIHVERYTLSDVAAFGSLDGNGCISIENKEVAVVYFRAGYDPKQYASQKEWDARLMLDRSKAINCPSAGHQLVGAKKMQQVLAQPGIVEKFIKDPEAVKRIRETFVAFYGLETIDEANSALSIAKKNPDKFVLKPNLEGGGNNLYGKDIENKLIEVGKDERRCSYILMEKIRPFAFDAIMLRPGCNWFKPVECVSELGIFGVILASGEKIIQNTCAGHLLRTKPSNRNEGGIIGGTGALDSPLLFDDA